MILSANLMHPWKVIDLLERCHVQDPLNRDASVDPKEGPDLWISHYFESKVFAT
jgi:hypothetical protein